jgi:hypothetical protein
MFKRRRENLIAIAKYEMKEIHPFSSRLSLQ